jgi:integrase
VSTCYDTAERIDGVLSLRWIDMEWDTSSLIIKAEGRKGSRADRRYVVHPTTCATLGRIANAGPLVFTWDRSPTSMWDHYRRILEAAGLPTGRETMFHALRKTHATELHRSGGDATASLDHADARTTRRYLGQRAKPATQVDLLPRPVTLRLFVGDEQHSA